MLGQQNNIVKQQIIRQVKQLSSKQTMVQYYMSYDFPQKQRGMKNWWEELIENIIRKKNQIYINFKDLQSVTTIHNMKPSPLKQILKQLKKQFVFAKQTDLFPEKQVQKVMKPWYSNIYDWAWSKKQQKQLNPFKFQDNQKIISNKIKQRKKKQLKNYLHDQFLTQSTKPLKPLIRQLTYKLKIDQASVNILLKQLKKQRDVYLGQQTQQGNNFITYHIDRKKMQDQNFLKIQKIKYLLKVNQDKFQNQYDKCSSKISNLKVKAKDALHNEDRNKAKVYLVQVKKQQQRRQNINLRRTILDQKLAQIQINQMNKSSIDLLQDATKIYQEVAIDPDKFDEVMQQSRQMQMQSEEGNRRFAQMAASEQIADQVDDLLKQLQGQISQKKKVVEPKMVNVNISQKKQQKQKYNQPQKYII